VPDPRNDREQRIQRELYRAGASGYDDAHVHAHDEHHFALAFLVGSLEYLGAESVLDVGSGTGRALRYLAAHAPRVRRHGVEPVAELRAIAHDHGVSAEELTSGDAAHLTFADASFDVVCAFGVLHHVRDHAAVVREMLRVARSAVLISDSNNFGQGSALMRSAKQLLHAAGLWPAANLLKTRGKGYSVTEGDGLAYSYSVFDDLPLVRAACRSVHVLNTRDAGVNPYRTASHAAVLGIK
jgi:ubiquinone/menaquinone biosynthesis C-methylase UbiE